MNIDIILRALGADAVADSFQRVASGAHNLGNASSDASTGVVKLSGDLSDAAQSATNANAKFEAMRNAGVAIAAAGAAALVLSSNLRQAATEGADAQKKLEDMFAKRGEGGRVEELSDWAGQLSKQAAMVDDDPIKEAAAQLAGFGVNADQVKGIMPGLIGQSRLYNQSLESVAMAFGKAFASGNAGALKKSGVTLDQADIDKLKDIEDPIQKQQMLFEMVKKSMDQYALGMREGMSEATINANLLANEMDSLYTGMGEGAATVHNAITAHLLLPLLEVANSSPTLQHAAGAIIEIGGAAGSTIGAIMGFVGQVGMANMGLQAMGLSGIGAFRGIMTSALAAAPAIWASFAPLIPLILAIAAAALVTTAAMYKLSGAKDAVDQAAKDEAQADAADKKFYDDQKAKGKIKVSFAEWQKQMGRGQENADDTSSPDSSTDTAALNKQLGDLKNLKYGAAPVPEMPTIPQLSVPVPSSSNAIMQTDEDEEDGIQGEGKTTDKAAKDAKRASERAAKAAARQAEKDKKAAERAADKAAKAATQAKEYDRDVAKARSDDKFDAEIESLEDALDKAKGDANATKIKALTLQLETARAKKARSGREMDIAQTALTDAKKAASMKSVSDIEFEGDMRRANRTSSKAGVGRDGVGTEQENARHDAAVRAAVAKLMSGSRIGGGYSGGFAPLNPAGSARASRGEVAIPQAQVESLSQNSDGSLTIQFGKVQVPYMGIGGL